MKTGLDLFTGQFNTDHINKLFDGILAKNPYLTRKRFSEKPIVAFTNSTVLILDF